MNEKILTASALGLIDERGFSRILNHDKLNAKKRGLLIEAHPDDGALAEGISETLVSKGISMSALTLTDGGARNIEGYTRNGLVRKRRRESRKGFDISGFTDMYHAGFHDGFLSEHSEEGIAIVQGIIEIKKPDFIIVTHQDDAHPDHASAARIALNAAVNEYPIYFMDTVTMTDKKENPLDVTHVFSVDNVYVSKRNDAYRAHTSQVTNLPEKEMEDVKKVFDLPIQRGHSVEVPLAAVLFQANPSLHDYLGNELEEQLLFYAAKAA